MFKSKVYWEDEIETIKQMGMSGYKMPAIADKYEVSRQRIKQIIDKYIPTWKDEFSRNPKQEAKDKSYKEKWGDKPKGTSDESYLYKVKREKWRAKKYNAIRTGYEWSLEFSDLKWPTHCPMLGLELDYFAEYRSETSVSFDRLDSSKGYVKGNVVVVSWRANRIKNDGTAEEHRKIADYLDTLKDVK
jgi:hypothetical protein